MTLDLFATSATPIAEESLGPGAMVLRGFALDEAPALLGAIDAVLAQAPLRRMVTPGGYRMSVEMSNCGSLGWITDRTGYRYDTIDPLSGERWPPMPAAFGALARRAADRAGFANYVPDACLINHYAPGTKLSLHQDKDERDYAAPIVSVSLGIPAMFVFGGERRADRQQRVPVRHGDVVVWGGPARLRYHGVLPLKHDQHALLGPWRYNLTLRKAG